jgi:hypothetical protein
LKIYHPSATIPAAAITLATHLGNEIDQPILFTTQRGYKGNFRRSTEPNSLAVGEASSLRRAEPNSNLSTPPNTEGDLTTLEWVVRSITINLVRDWSASTFEVVLTCSLPDKPNLQIPRLPDVSFYRKGEYPYLDKEDEIRIYMGYIDSPQTPITADLLDWHPFTVGQNISDPKKPLCPVFWGFIDKIDFVGDRAGAQLVISGRDRCRIFQDTRVISLRSLERSVLEQKDEEGKVVPAIQGARSTILLDIARAAAGQSSDQNQFQLYEESDKKYWKYIIGTQEEEGGILSLPPEDYSYGFSKASGGFTPRVPNPQEPSSQISGGFTPRVPNPQEPSSQIDVLTDAMAPEKILEYATRKVNSRGYVRFHRWVFRPPIVTRGRNAIYQVFNRVPIDIVNYLAANEERPIDFYSSHVNGDFLFAPRVLDTTGLKDPSRNYRTYFYNSWPEKAGSPSHGQVILKIRAVSSTLGTFNRFSIASSGVSGRGEDTLAALTFILENYGQGLRGRNPNPPSRHQLIVDDNLNTYNNALIGATTIAFQSSRSWSRELNAVQMTILGDPTLYPGEAIQVYNSVLHDYNVSTSIPSLDAFQAYEQRLETSLNNLESNFPLDSRQAAEQARNGIPTEVDSILGELTNLRTLTDKDANLFPIYKCRSIRHRLTTVGQQAGFTTELALVGDL